jgi:NAD-dependent DNA ligase
MIAEPESYTPNQIVILLKSADDDYSNDGESFIEDNEYDALRLIAQRLAPTDEYFLGIGSDVRGGKVKLPFEMGSLNQVEVGEIEDWVRKNNLQDEQIVITDKMDGTSALIVYNKGGFPQIAYSRGNGTEGADISRHIFKIKNVPEQLTSREKMTVRAEVELSETAFAKLRTIIFKSDGKPYKNARNMVAGIMNSSERPDVVYDYLTVIAYQIVDEENMSKSEMLDSLKEEGFQVENYSTVWGYELKDEFLAKFLNHRRSVTDYAIDGVVLDVDRQEKRAKMNPTRDTLNPEYSIKYKVADESNLAIATVKGVTWNISKHGFLKPQVNIEPVDLVGVTVSNATGFNAKFIKENGIGAGAKVKITRSGDVIPFILECVEQSTADMPTEECEWNETGVDLVLLDKNSNEEVKIQQAIDFFMSIDAPHLREGSVRKLSTYTDGDIIGDIIRMNKSELVSIIGANGVKIYNGLRTKLTNMPAYVLLGSVPFFGRGVGKRKFKKLFSGLQIKSINELPVINVSQIRSVDEFEEKTAKKIVSGVAQFMDWFEDMNGYITIGEEAQPTGTSMSGQKIVFTGFRDKDLQAAVEAAGGEMQSGVSGKTTMLVTKDPTSTSGKVQKARDKGVKIVGIDELKGML